MSPPGNAAATAGTVADGPGASADRLSIKGSAWLPYRAAGNRGPLSVEGLTDVLSRLGGTASSSDYSTAVASEYLLPYGVASLAIFNACSKEGSPIAPIPADGPLAGTAYRLDPRKARGLAPRHLHLVPDQPRSPWDMFGPALARQTGPESIPEPAPAAVVAPGRLVPAASLLDEPEPVWLIDRTIPDTGVGQIVGPSYTGKTYVALDLALRVVNGLPDWFGRKITSPGPVVYVLMEGRFDFAQRVRAWLQAHPDTSADGLWVLPSPDLNLTSADSVGRLLEDARTAGVRPRLVIVDTQALATAGAEENSSRDMGLVFAHLNGLAEQLRTFVFTVHHTGKDSSKGARGSSAQYAALDVQVVVDDGQVRAAKVKPWQPWAEAAGFRIVSSGPSAVIQPADVLELLVEKSSARRSDLARLVLQAVEAEPGLHLARLTEMVPGNRAARRDTVEDLVSEGALRRESGPGNSVRLYRVEALQ